jgi:CheY-like chemotaxis protein
MSFTQYTVLVVDDEELLRNALVFDFKRKGFTVLAAENGVKAFELVRTHKVDLVISDMKMPGGDGLTLLENIRVYDPKIPVLIFITGYADLPAEEAIAKGAYGMLSKPFERQALFLAVMNALGLAFRD